MTTTTSNSDDFYDISMDAVLTANLFTEQNTEIKYIHDDVLKTPQPRLDSTKSVNLYLGTGYLKNVYNTELCDNKWLIMIYLINRLRDNFTTQGKIKLKSLHLHCMPGSELSAMHHFLYNSEVTHQVDWEWVGTISAFAEEDNYNIQRAMKYKYKNNMLNLLNADLCAINNINYVVNETLNRLGPVRFICASKCKISITDFMTYAVFSIKILDTDGICYINMNDPSEWTGETLSGVTLMGLLFQGLHLYRFNSGGVLYGVLICKKKKRLNSEILYKKLINILDDPDAIKSYNLFIADHIQNTFKSDALHKLLSGEAAAPVINCADIIHEVESTLKMNINMFL